MSAKFDLAQLPNKPLWFAPAPPRARLEGDIQADVVIVGAGYTGLWTAYYLLKADPSLNVVLLEKREVGFGASGRNGGWASAIFPISLQRVEQLYSHQAALHLQAVMNDTVDEIGRVLALEGVDADYAKQGFMSLARSGPQMARARAAVESSARFGLAQQWRVLEAGEAHGSIGAQGTLGALYTEHCALIHPGKLVRGLAQLVESLGARIYEQSAVTGMAPGVVHTGHGSVRAGMTVRATEAFTSQQPGKSRFVIPLYSLVLATEPLAPELLSQLNLDHRMAFNDMRHLRVYGQVTAEGRLVFGGRGAPYKWGSVMPEQADLVDSIHGKIYDTMLEFFPALRDARVTHRWGGALGVARDWCPTVSIDRSKGMAWAGNYVGDGVATSNLAGRILRNLILERDDALNTLPLVNHQSPAWEREPLRWFGINSGLAAASLSDLEERYTHKPSRTAMLLEKLTGAH
ncbi:NAD(P)/FAD-dependent oxidoreductase [Pseudomonas xanthosomatis]|uniref:NAD(P)/FAD-dependent oxidoreductase n=1 Tax=Pseudomonas xanthosomatis TaxID=2842356 RepID=UPI0035132747